MSDNFERPPQPTLDEQPPEPEDKPEQELSPEAIEKIMEKVQDIFEYGTAYTCALGTDADFREHYLTKDGKFEETLRNGVVGTARDIETNVSQQTSEWKKHLKEGHQVTVSFNIMGRSFSYGVDPLLPATHTGNYKPRNPSIDVPKYLEQLYSQEKEHHMFGNQWFHGLAITFDISDLKELPPKYASGGDHRKRKKEEHEKYITPYPLRTYGIRGPVSETIQTPDSRGNLCTTTEYGFSISSRIPPRRFRGLIVKWELQKQLPTLTNVMKSVYKNEPQSMLPIYDYRGNLIWPKRMSYEEVKQFVAERQRREGTANSGQTTKSSPE